MDQSSASRVNATETSLEIVEALVELNGATLTELADHVKMNKSTAYNHLQTLLNLGYVVHGDEYEVGLKFLRIGEYARAKREILKVGKTEVDKLAESTGELANLVVAEHGEGVFLYRSQGDEAVHMDTHVGRRVPLHTTAFGKAIMTHLPETEVENIIESKGLNSETPNTITDQDELYNEFETIRRKGYAFDDEERIQGLRCVAAPVIVEGDVHGAISVSGPKDRMKGSWFQNDLPEEVVETAGVVEINLTFG